MERISILAIEVEMSNTSLGVMENNIILTTHLIVDPTVVTTFNSPFVKDTCKDG